MSLQSNKIMEQTLVSDSSELLNNIIKNITTCFGDTYSVDKITKIYNELCIIPKNTKLTEQEFTQLIIKKLTTIKNKTKSKNKLSSEDILANLSSALCNSPENMITE